MDSRKFIICITFAIALTAIMMVDLASAFPFPAPGETGDFGQPTFEVLDTPRLRSRQRRQWGPFYGGYYPGGYGGYGGGSGQAQASAQASASSTGSGYGYGK